MGHSPIARAKGSLTLPANTHLVYNGYQKITMSTPEPDQQYRSFLDELSCNINMIRSELERVKQFSTKDEFESLVLDIHSINASCITLRDKIDKLFVDNLPY